MGTLINKIRHIFLAIYFSLPIQLLINNFRKNQILLILWLVLFLCVTQMWGRMFGIPYLFLDPEYMNEVNTTSMFILGFFMGLFSMSFQITNYILDAQKFTFLGYLQRPFGKFVINNSLISWAFLFTYLITFFQFQFNNGFQDHLQISLEALVFAISYVGVHILLYLYFKYTNKDIFKLFAHNIDQKLTQKKVNRINMLRPLRINPFKSTVRVDSYFDLYTFSFKKVDPDIAYDKSYLVKVFDQNHLNAAMIQLISLVLILVLSLMKERPAFQFPAGASIMILFSVLVTVTGFISYWFRNWAITAGIFLFLMINFFVKLGFYDTTYKAFGLNYKAKKAEYSLRKIREISNVNNYHDDVDSTTKILNNWKAKFKDTLKKPKIVFICASGGGQRAAVWTVRSLQVADSLTQGKLLNQSILMTGASGGMIGMCYYRELKLREMENKGKLSQDKAFYGLARDVLNPVAFSLVVNDLFFRTKGFSFAHKEYEQDRGYSFENQLNLNSENLLWKKVIDYKKPEEKAMIPMVIMAPTIINDGRKLHIAAQHISYMSSPLMENKTSLRSQRQKSIEFKRFFKDQDADSLSFTSALRMSATFPYITPNVTLPSEPEMEVMDAGLSDNFGFGDALRFMYVFKDWIAENTSGVVIVAIRDSEKEREIEQNAKNGIIDKMLNPIGSLYQSWDYLQDINNDNIVEFAKGWLQNDIDVVDIMYTPRPKYWKIIQEKDIDARQLDEIYRIERASLSWHLTTREKESLKRTIFEPNNIAAIKKLQDLLK